MGRPTQSGRYWLSCSISDGRFGAVRGLREPPENGGNRPLGAPHPPDREFFSGSAIGCTGESDDSGRKGRGGSHGERGVSRPGSEAHRTRPPSPCARAGQRGAGRRRRSRAVRDHRVRSARCHLRRPSVGRGADRPAHHRGARAFDRPGHGCDAGGSAAGGHRRAAGRPQPRQASVRRHGRDRHRAALGDRGPRARRPRPGDVARPGLLPPRNCAQWS